MGQTEVELGLGLSLSPPTGIIPNRRFKTDNIFSGRTDKWSGFKSWAKEKPVIGKLANMSKRALLLGVWHEGLRWGMTTAVITGAIKVEKNLGETLVAGTAYGGALLALTAVEAWRSSGVLNPVVEAGRLGLSAIGVESGIVPRILASLPNKIGSFGLETVWNGGGEMLMPGLSTARLFTSAFTVTGEVVANLGMEIYKQRKGVKISGITNDVRWVL